MKSGMIRLWAIVMLLVFLQSGIEGTQSVSNRAGGMYTEDFSAYTYQDYAENTKWDIWAGALYLALTPGDTIQYKPAIAADGNGGYFVVWEDWRNGQSDIYAQRLDGGGNRLWVIDIRVNSDVGTEEKIHPDVAVDGSGNAIVVWEDNRNGNPDIYAQRLNAGGSKLWASDIRVNSDSLTVDQQEPAVAVDGGGYAFVVWGDDRNGNDDNDDIYAQRLDTIGNRIWMADVRVNSDIGTEDQASPGVDVDSSGAAFVVWQDNRNSSSDVYAQRLNSNGNKLWAADVQVNSVTGSIWYGASPCVAIDGSGSAFVAWEDGRNGHGDAYVQRLDANGNKLWAADVKANIESGTTDGYPFIAVAVDDSGTAFVTWRDDRHDWWPYTYAQRLDAGGNRLWATDMRVSDYDSPSMRQEYAAVAVDNGNIFVVWNDGRSDNQDVYAQQLDADGNRLWTADAQVNLDVGAAEQESLAIAGDDNGTVIMVWSDNRDGNWNIYARQVDDNGNRLWANDVQVNMGDGRSYSYSPRVAMDSSGNAVVVWRQIREGTSYSNLYAQKLNAGGSRLWASDVLVNDDIEMYIYGYDVAVYDSDHTLVVWGDARNGDYDIYAQRLDAGGNGLWGADARVSSDIGTISQRSPVIAEDSNGNAVVVWSNYYQNNDYDIYAQRVDTAGNRLWAVDVRVNSDSGTTSQNYAAVDVDDSGNAFIVWADKRNGYPTDIYAQRLDTIGNKLWVADTRVDPIDGISQSSPDVAVGRGGNAFVVWLDSRVGSYDYDVYAQKLDTGGSKLWGDDKRVNADIGKVSGAPGVAAGDSYDVLVAWEDERNHNKDIYAQKINSLGSTGWGVDLQLVSRDSFYMASGAVQSRAVDDVSGDIHSATLTANYQANGGGVQFYLTNDGGANWFPVISGVAHVFVTSGSDLRWKVVLTVDPVWQRTPVVNSLQIEYRTAAADGDNYEADDTCAQAKAIALNGMAQEHTFHQYDDADWVWFEAVAGSTYIIQTTHTGSNADTVLELFNVCGQAPLQYDDNAFSPGSIIVFPAAASGTYYARVSQHDSTIYGEDTDYQLSIRTQSSFGAVVIVAGRMMMNDTMQPAINATANLAYRTFLENGFSKENIYYLNADLTQDADNNSLADDVDGVPTQENIRDAIQTWARARVGLGIPLWVYLMDHGDVDRFYNEVGEQVGADELNMWLGNLEELSKCDQITVIIEACFSGSFIDTQAVGQYGIHEISESKRVVVSSTSSRWWAYSPDNVSPTYFSAGFFQALGQSQDVWSAFLAGRAYVESAGHRCGDYAYSCQRPWLDDTGDAWFDSNDGQVAQRRGLAASFGGVVVPYIDWVEVEDIVDGQATIRAQVRDNGSVARVWARVFAPSFEPPTSTDGSIPVITVPERDLGATGSDVFEIAYDAFTEEGAYQVVVYAMDDEGNVGVPRWVLTGENVVYLPLVLRSE